MSKKKPALAGLYTVEDEISIPYAEPEDTLECGFRAEMFSLSDSDDVEDAVASLCTGSGLGNDFITMTFKGRNAVITGRDLMVAWVRTFDPAAADELASMFAPEDESAEEAAS